jgi:hypothetical protein
VERRRVRRARDGLRKSFFECHCCSHLLPDISLPEYESRTDAKFCVRRLLICLRLQNGKLRALLQHVRSP